MKSNSKKSKMNPAFKLRQVLPLLPNHAARAGAATGTAKNATPRNSAAPEATATWVTTE